MLRLISDEDDILLVAVCYMPEEVNDQVLFLPF